MTDKKSSESRRKLLKSIVAGSGAIVAGKSLPESWSRPVVDSVMLPAHAQTSVVTYGGTESEFVSVDPTIMDMLVPVSIAGTPEFMPFKEWRVCGQGM